MASNVTTYQGTTMVLLLFQDHIRCHPGPIAEGWILSQDAKECDDIVLHLGHHVDPIRSSVGIAVSFLLPQQPEKACLPQHEFDVQATVSKVAVDSLAITQRKRDVLAGVLNKEPRSRSKWFVAVATVYSIRLRSWPAAGLVPVVVDQGRCPDMNVRIVADQSKQGVPARLADRLMKGAPGELKMRQVPIVLHKGLTHGGDGTVLDRQAREY
ncbi:unnamed protein product [Pseudo-nitzschia multistriata]|uniref:Uncharacterized protein n=1 Tax=Pseudo-nitzschia multistriata TaxID=183589 RepID=A0A448Z5V3_9STRA|nr:unnamed protein product [Pseudo-nitzschia multistriata]